MSFDVSDIFSPLGGAAQGAMLGMSAGPVGGILGGLLGGIGGLFGASSNSARKKALKAQREAALGNAQADLERVQSSVPRQRQSLRESLFARGLKNSSIYGDEMANFEGEAGRQLSGAERSLAAVRAGANYQRAQQDQSLFNTIAGGAGSMGLTLMQLLGGSGGPGVLGRMRSIF